MPHCVIEYAEALEKRVSPQTLVSTVHQGALDSGLFEPASVKTRAIAYRHYLVAGKETDFVHVTLHILSGRSSEQKQQLSAKVLERLHSQLSSAISLTVQVEDMEKQSYAKFVG